MQRIKTKSEIKMTRKDEFFLAIFGLAFGWIIASLFANAQSSEAPHPQRVIVAHMIRPHKLTYHRGKIILPPSLYQVAAYNRAAAIMVAKRAGAK